MSKITCEHCARRVDRGSHFVCQGKPVNGTSALFNTARDTIRSYADWGSYQKARKS
jgi:hypothetical protein